MRYGRGGLREGRLSDAARHAQLVEVLGHAESTDSKGRSRHRKDVGISESKGTLLGS